MILKIQRPLFPVDAPFMVYDETRTFMREIPERQIPHRVVESCRFGKAYWTARITGKYALEFMQQIGPQAW